jgi:glycosyltransferase involved in cell wall biosynthesis
VRILIYAPAARMGGARAHLLGLVPQLAAMASHDEVLLLAQPDLLADLPELPAGWSLRVERAQARGFLGRLGWEQGTLPRIAERWRADVLLSFGSFVPLRCACPTVLEAGNALPFTSAYWHVLRGESWRMQVEEYARWALLRASLRAAERILVPTRAMRQDVVMRLPELAERIDVALWGVASVFHQRRWRQPPGETVLGVSKHGINKEFDVLIQALCHLAKGVQLVLTGTAAESRWSRSSATLVSQLGLDGRVCFAGDVPNPLVPDLIGQAQLLVFPTWCESFGLPLAEALAMGAPAIAGDIPACREVGADAACFYAPGDAQSLARSIAGLLKDAPRRDALAEAAYERGRVFQWRDNAVLVRRTLERAVRGRG